MQTHRQWQTSLNCSFICQPSLTSYKVFQDWPPPTTNRAKKLSCIILINWLVLFKQVDLPAFFYSNKLTCLPSFIQTIWLTSLLLFKQDWILLRSASSDIYFICLYIRVDIFSFRFDIVTCNVMYSLRQGGNTPPKSWSHLISFAVPFSQQTRFLSEQTKHFFFAVWRKKCRNACLLISVTIE